MLKLLTTLMILGASTAAMAEIDFSEFDLNPDQLALLQRLEKKGAIAEKVLLDTAASFHAHNQPQTVRYIPPFTLEELYDLADWAEGAAYRIYAKDAGVEFDFKAYMEDCPNLSLFGFGRATGTSVLPIDVTAKTTNTTYNLAILLAKYPEDFQKKYLDLVMNSPFAKYISIPGEDMKMVQFWNYYKKTASLNEALDGLGN